jgi:hypothetical protein
MLEVSSPKFWRRRLRVSVRTMMILVLILGGALGWMVHRAHVQRSAVAAIRPSIYAIRYDWEFKDGRSISGGKPWEPKWLLDILGVDYFHDVTMVNFSGRPTDADMACLGNLTGADTLVLNPSNVSDLGLAHLSRLTSIRWLTIDSSSLSSSDAVITRLTRLKVLGRLRGLNLDRSAITETGLGHLDGLTGLELLGLADTRVTDAGLARLRGLTGLRHLFLNGTQVSDEGLVHLSGMVNLTHVQLKGTKVTDGGVRGLKKALPKLQVYW